MPGISSLLKSAEATQRRIRQQRDAEVAYEWQLSAKTYEDFQAYQGYLRSQASSATDPSDLLGYEKNINSARSSYVSNEIQRQSIDVIEGRSTNTEKKSAMTRLYYMSVDEGNFDLAQSMNLQIDNLDLKIQAEADAAQALAGKMAILQAKSVEDAVDLLKGYSKELNDIYREKGPEQFNKEMSQYAEELGVAPGDFFGMHLRIAQEVNSVYDNELASDSDPDNQRKFQKAKNTFNSSNAIELPGTNGKSISVSYQDLVDQADAARTGQTIFRAVKTADGTGFERNKETGFVWGRDEAGNYRAIKTYQPTTDYSSTVYKTQISSKGDTQYLDSNDQVVAVKGKDGNIRGINGKTINDASKQNYADLLKQNGFNVISGGGSDYIEIATPRDLMGLVPSETTQLYVNKDGQLQVVGENGNLYNFGFDQDSGKFTGYLKDQPNPITMLNDNFSQDFLNKLDRNNLPGGTIGIVDTGLASSQLLRVGEFTRADIANKEQLAKLEKARQEADTRAKAQAVQAIQPTLNPQLAPQVNLQSPANALQRLQPDANVQLQSPSTAQNLQGSSSRSQNVNLNQGPSRGVTIRL
jgi:hypothetical protein